MSRRIHSLSLALACAFTAFAARADFKNIVPKSSVPDAVMSAANDAFPGADWLVVKKFAGPEGDTFMLLGKDSQDRLVEYCVRAHGRNGLPRIHLQWEEAPSHVTSAAEQAAPGIEWEKAVTEPDGEGHSYRCWGKDASGRDVWVELSSKGTCITRFISLAEVPARVRAALCAKRPRFQPEDEVKVLSYNFNEPLVYEFLDAIPETCNVLVRAKDCYVTDAN